MNNLLENAKKYSYQKLRLSLPDCRRFLYHDVLSSKDKIVGIYGSRGVGKTTLMLQVSKELDMAPDEILYISCDHLMFSGVSLFSFIEYAYTYGIKCILIDEIHEAKNFEQELKSVYDFLDIKIIFSGSSAVQLTNASFSRRYAMLKLPVLSLGTFPYYFVNKDSYQQKTTDSINTILYTDMLKQKTLSSLAVE